jgi:hypothetical protein
MCLSGLNFYIGCKGAVLLKAGLCGPRPGCLWPSCWPSDPVSTCQGHASMGSHVQRMCQLWLTREYYNLSISIQLKLAGETGHDSVTATDSCSNIQTPRVSESGSAS